MTKNHNTFLSQNNFLNFIILNISEKQRHSTLFNYYSKCNFDIQTCILSLRGNKQI